ncbi:MAG: hypothetical protein ACI88A_004084 [Paraglaciecola sp.]|jgi:hypothetical protein
MPNQPCQRAGLGDPNASLCIYIGNRPDYQDLTQIQHVQPLLRGEIDAVGKMCGNGWRKVFNVYAKLVFALPDGLASKTEDAANWQAYRDDALLQRASDTALIFSAPKFEGDARLHIVMGRTYAKSLQLPASLVWLDKEFAIDRDERLIVCPYFDYRQLSNSKIIRLVELMESVYQENSQKI